MNKNQKLEQVDWTTLKNGDKILASAELEVSSADRYEGVVYVKGGGRIRAKKGYSTTAPVFKIEKISQTEPDHWPVQLGDVWRDGNGTEYHVINDVNSWSSSKAVYNTSGDKISTDALKEKSGIKLAYRKGNSTVK